MKHFTTLISILLLCATSVFSQAPEHFTYQAVVRNASNSLVTNAQVGVRVNILHGSAMGNVVYSESHVTTSNTNGLITVNIGGGSVQHGSFADIDWENGPYFLETDIDPNGGNDYTIKTTQQLLSVPYALYASKAGNVPQNVGELTNDANYITLEQVPEIPANVSAFNNDAGYITMDSVPTIPAIPNNVSAFQNDANYITLSQVPAQVNADWNATSGAAQILNKPTLFSGNYNDLENKPNIPTVPTNVGAFTNDAGYLTGYTEQQVLSISHDTLFLTGGSFVKLPETLSPEQIGNMVAQSLQAMQQYADSISSVTFQQYISQLTSDAMRHYLDSIAEEAGRQYIDSVYHIPGQHVSHDSVFSTGPCPEAPYLLDWDGNVYNTVKIGSQCWMKENLRTWHYADGTLIPNQNGNSDTPNRHAPGGDVANVPKYGYLYNWSAVMNGAEGSNAIPSGVQGICPSGWHVPSKGEWEKLVDFMGNYSQYLCSDITNYIAKSLATDDTIWDTPQFHHICEPGTDPTSNNSSGFSIVPAGNGLHDDWWQDANGQYAYLATTTTDYGYYGYFNHAFTISYSEPSFSFTPMGNNASGLYQSVRCLRDEEGDNGMSQVLPTVITDFANVTGTSATLIGRVTNPDNVTITARGFEWKATEGGSYAQVEGTELDSSIAASLTALTGNSGYFVTALTGLTANTEYTYRAFVTTAAGTTYGNEKTFTTPSDSPYQPWDGTGRNPNDSLPCQGTPTVTDIDGNTYSTVQIGHQCWMRENLRTSHFADGTEIPRLTNYQSWNDILAAAYDYENDTAYGFVYNYYAVATGALCPTGWHVPTYNDVHGILRDYLGNSSVGGQLKTTGNAYWSSPNTGATNSSGFSARGGGYKYDVFYNLMEYGVFWTSTMHNQKYSYDYLIIHDNDGLHNLGHSEYDGALYEKYGLSVRCLRDSEGTLPVVTTASVSNVSTFSAVCGGNVTDEGSDAVTARGVCWSIIALPSIRDSHTEDGSGTGAFTSNIMGLSPGTTYYVRAYATNSAGTVYGQQLTITTAVDNVAHGQPCPGMPTVTDHEGNVYNTVQIGTQCWTRENMRATTSPSTGTNILENSVNSHSYTGKKAYYVNGNAANTATYGLLYNWCAAVDTFNTMYGETSTDADKSHALAVTFSGHRRGICPEGWHVPTDEEWMQLTDFVGEQVAFQCDGNSQHIAKALSSTKGWNTSMENCGIGDNPSSNNATGFNALPAGYCADRCINFGFVAYFRTATQEENYRTWGRGLFFDMAIMGRGNDEQYLAFSVRCLRN